MTAKEYTGDRKRSRPVTKRSMGDKMKNNWILTVTFILILVIVVIAGAVYFITNIEDEKTEDNNTNGNGDGNDDNGLVANNDNFKIFKKSVDNRFDVLLNDEDDNKSSLNLIIVGTPKHGNASISGSYIYYTPNDDFENEDSFVYTVLNEKNNTATATVTVSMNPSAIISTSKGTITVGLYADKVPNTCNNFIKLANDGFYQGVIFHRIKQGFMIQAGNMFPDGSTQESPYGLIDFESHPDVSHVDGAISMASTASGVGGSAQFFICDGDQSFLDGNYAAFGVVISGINVVRDIASTDHDGSLEPNPGGGKPLEDITINSITIEN